MKAKDLRGKNIEDIEDIEDEASEPKPSVAEAKAGGQEDDAVAAAYENISKKLESIRNGKTAGEEDSDEDSERRRDEKDQEGPELEEWKGPKPPVKESKEPDESDEREIKKVNLRNLENEKDESKESSSDRTESDGPEKEDEVDPLDVKDEGEDLKGRRGDEEDEKEVKEWKPKEGDPLDDEEDEEEEESKESDESKDSEDEEVGEKDTESLHSEVRRPVESEPADMPEDRDEIKREEPDTLDDLADESPFARKEEVDSGEDAKEREGEKPPYDRDREEEYSIPNLKGSRQEGTNIGYNATSPRESVGQSYSPKGAYMEGNDPNNFFSQHQPQPAKRANKFHLLVLIIIGIVVIGFTVYILKGGFGGINLGTSQPSPSPSVIATPEPTPTPTPEPEVNRGDFTVRVLNGTSTSGLAKTVSDKLKEAGFKTTAPGNAAERDVEQTEIRVKEGTESAALFERIKLDLAPDYDAKQGENLDEDSKNDAEIILGSK